MKEPNCLMITCFQHQRFEKRELPRLYMEMSPILSTLLLSYVKVLISALFVAVMRRSLEKKAIELRLETSSAIIVCSLHAATHCQNFKHAPNICKHKPHKYCFCAVSYKFNTFHRAIRTAHENIWDFFPS